jgi:hypothetical protein
MSSSQGEVRIREMKIGNKNRKRGARDLSREKDETIQVSEDTKGGPETRYGTSQEISE